MSNKLWLAPLALACGASFASADTLYMQDGRRIQGELLSMNANGTIVFDQTANGVRVPGNRNGARRIRIDRDDVRRIDFTDDADDGSFFGDDSDNDTGYPGVVRDIVVRSDQAWTDTGIRVRAGEVFRIEADGFVRWGPNRNDDPNGQANSPYNANRPLPSRAGGALIGRIGNGAPFFVGSGMQSFRAGTVGELYLGVNDDFLRDNTGSFRVTVTPR
jgi:PA-IL-like protein